ncbi:MAG TPA: hypothetical protein VJP02_08105 [Candidatus Sulfotelmatobacter sp.]|nr:hypothetical protein [Candidatus Sulfotelmatobacter sp.]
MNRLSRDDLFAQIPVFDFGLSRRSWYSPQTWRKVLTTYAGLLLRDLLDRFNGDVEKAVGIYNGGSGNPNIRYAAGVKAVAEYARNILERVTAMSEEATADTLERRVDASSQ